MNILSRLVTSISSWPKVRWVALTITAVLTFLVIGIPTDVVPNPFFGREIEVTPWALTVLVLTSLFSGALLATYIQAAPNNDDQASAKFGGVGAVLTYFAIGCPVCNKIALIALGYTGAIQYFAPIQPYLGAFSIALLFYTFSKRVLNEGVCKISN
jgi:hypothetical protein